MHSYKSNIRNLLQLAIPVSIGQLGHIMMGVVDSLMVGRIGAAPLAASSIAGGIFFIIFVIGLGVSFAISPLIAISVGSRKLGDCSDILNNSFWVNLFLAVILFLILFFGSNIVFYLHQPEPVTSLAVSYLKIISFSVFPLMIFQTYKQFVEGFSIMRPAMIITIFANLVNIIGNWILIYGKFGLPAMGLDGAGLSTLINRIFMAIFMVLYVTKSDYFKKFHLQLSIKKLNADLVKKILRLGLSSGFQYFFEVGAFSGAAIMVGWIGTDELAAHQIALNLSSVTYMLITGISAAAAILVGNAVGQENIEEIRRAGFSALILAGSIMAFFGLCFILFNSFLPQLYISDVKVISIASLLLIIASIFEISDGIQAVGLGILRGITDVKIPTIVTFIAYWVLAIPSGYLLAFSFGLGVYGIWYGFIIGLAASALMLTLRFNFRSKQKIHIT